MLLQAYVTVFYSSKPKQIPNNIFGGKDRWLFQLVILSFLFVNLLSLTMFDVDNIDDGASAVSFSYLKHLYIVIGAEPDTLTVECAENLCAQIKFKVC